LIVGIFSDVHGNGDALDVVARELENHEAEEIVCLGDLVGYGAEPNKVVEWVKDHADRCVLGNHDAGVAGYMDTAWFNTVARISVDWTFRVLKQDNLDYLRSLKPCVCTDHLMAVHAAPADPLRWKYILHPGAARAEFSAFDQPVCFVGHSHVPMLIEKSGELVRDLNSDHVALNNDCRYIVNVGSVGQPRDADPRISFCIYDTESGSIEIKRAEYDVQAAREKIISAGLPPILGDRLTRGE
jgi:diadenosine tetraphosphatase ApaH/serine/threonine PP2A family protein phosphatase